MRSETNADCLTQLSKLSLSSCMNTSILRVTERAPTAAGLTAELSETVGLRIALARRHARLRILRPDFSIARADRGMLAIRRIQTAHFLPCQTYRHIAMALRFSCPKPGGLWLSTQGSYRCRQNFGQGEPPLVLRICGGLLSDFNCRPSPCRRHPDEWAG